MKYREKLRIDHILEEFEVPEVLQKHLVGGMCGHDKDGLPIRIEPFGEITLPFFPFLFSTPLLQIGIYIRASHWFRLGSKICLEFDPPASTV